MKQISTSKKQYLLLLLVFLVYALGTCMTQFMQADDYFWYYTFQYDELAKYRMPNGRYISNILTHLIVRYPVVRILLFTGLLFCTLWLMCKLVTRKNQTDLRGGWLVLLLYVTMPVRAYSEVLYYLSAYVIYVLPVVCVLAYLLMCFTFHESEEDAKMPLRVIAALILGTVGALCLESMTLYACFLAVFFVLWSLFAAKKRGLWMHIAYALGTALGTAIMFLNENYRSIASDHDQQGARYFEFEFSDMLAKLYQDIMPKFAKPIPLAHLLIVLGLYALYRKADRSQWTPARCRYASMASAMLLIYGAYIAFDTVALTFQETTWAMRVYAVQTALVFLYIISVIYLVYLFLPRRLLFRICIYLASATLHSLFFCVVGPISARCFYPNYVFWFLAAVEIALQTDPLQQLLHINLSRIAACVACGSMLYCVGMNKYAAQIQIEHLRGQLEKGNVRVFEIIDVPYEMFDGGSCVENPYYDEKTHCLLDDFKDRELPTSRDGINLKTGTITELYFRLWAEYYDLDVDPSTYRTIHFSFLDYNTDDYSTDTPYIPTENE